MHVILDSNIYLSDTHFRHELRTLTQYLLPTASTVVLPRVVQEEVQAVYRRSLHAALRRVRKESADVRRLIGAFDLPAVDLEVQTQEFASRVSTFPPGGQALTVDLTSGDLLELTRMAANRVRPFNQEGHGFRDAAIWLTVLGHARANPAMEVAFISSNTADFGRKGVPNALHPDLQLQLAKDGLTNVRYYSSVAEFLRLNLLVTTTIDLSLYPTVLEGSGDQLMRFEHAITRDLYVDEEHHQYSGESVSFDPADEFTWIARSSQEFRLNDHETYVLVEVEAEVPASELYPVGYFVDDERGEIHEDHADRPVMVSLAGTLALTFGPTGPHQHQLLNVRALGVDDSIPDTVPPQP
ncbi:PIN domain-containing protein [Deinococcus aquaedulcis]|uniref:PIN domain-containing protein n=1 Tax=Deinococcus aquaedulcis TaxID=2840455 RepID=UPI001C838947|nr:PIN domain-containing protein [Deinococcus aquaedulcis]